MGNPDLPVGAAGSEIVEADKQKAVRQAEIAVSHDPDKLADLLTSTYERGFKVGFELGIKTEKRAEPVKPRGLFDY